MASSNNRGWNEEKVFIYRINIFQVCTFPYSLASSQHKKNVCRCWRIVNMHVLWYFWGNWKSIFLSISGNKKRRKFAKSFPDFYARYRRALNINFKSPENFFYCARVIKWFLIYVKTSTHSSQQAEGMRDGSFNVSKWQGLCWEAEIIN